jgi:transposase
LPGVAGCTQGLSGFRGAARALTHARILLQADEAEGRPAWRKAAIAEMLEVSEPTISRVRKRFHEAGMEAALHRRHPEHGWKRKLDGTQEAHLIVLACSEAPGGREKWSLRLLAGRLVEPGQVEEVSHETIRRTLNGGTQTFCPLP